jgi:hypothetical protein
VTDFPDAPKFTSMLSLDVEGELGITFDKARMHGTSPLCLSRADTDLAVVYGMSKEYVQVSVD